MRLLDLCSGRWWGWSKVFAARGWECHGVDLETPAEFPLGVQFHKSDLLNITPDFIRYGKFDFIVCSTPCEGFAKFGLKCFYPAPPYPEAAIRLFNQGRMLCELSGLPHVLENVRAAQQFVGKAVHHCGPFYLWGNAVPPILPQGILKGRRLKTGGYKRQTASTGDQEAAAKVACIPPELANCVAAYAERLLEQSPARRENQGDERE